MDGKGPSPSIDRRSYVPAYAQLADILRHQVASGEFRPGDRLPSESELCSRYGVSPMTVRRSVNLLVDQGVVDTVQGLGTFARPVHLGEATFNLEGLQTALSGERITVRVLEASIQSADERVARKLSIAAGQRVVYIRRQILKRGEPFFYHREYMVYDPTRPIVEAELGVTSLTGLFSGEGSADVKWGELVIDPTVVNERESRLLNVPVGSPAFQLEHVFYDFDDRPLSWGWFVCPNDRLQIATTVGVMEEA